MPQRSDAGKEWTPVCNTPIGFDVQQLLSQAGLHALKQILLTQPLVAFDFDGTLAPIVDKPDDARVLPQLAASLAAVAALHPVAVISGRSVADLSLRLGFKPRFIVGNHGAEFTPGRQLEHPSLDTVREQLTRCTTALARAGVWVEDKGLTLALHYRQAEDHDEARRQIDIALRECSPDLRRFGGKYVVNIVPAGAADKAQAIERLLKQLGAKTVVFVGDDVNDEPVYARADPGWLTVQIGRESIDKRADFYLERQADLELMLRALLL